MKLRTRLTQPCGDSGDPWGAASTPIYQTATFFQEDPEQFGRFDYSRSDNPTRHGAEALLGEIENGDSLLFASGIAAISTCLRLVRPGQNIVAGADLYGGTFRLLGELVAPLGIQVRRVPLQDLNAASEAIDGNTRLVLLETPSNPLLQVIDLGGVARLARESGALLAVDNTMMTPLLQRPLDLGADLVIHSATKFLAGHSDVTAGAVVTRNAELRDRLAFLRNAEGNALAPFEAWLLARGMRTLSLRLERQQQNAETLALALSDHPGVEQVLSLALPDHPGRELHDRQAEGPGSVLCLRLGSRERARALVAETRLLRTAVSFGGLGSTISLPGCMSHASIPEEQRRVDPLPDDLVRISVGIEDPQDLLDDLERGLRAEAVTYAACPG
ncbi:hypothetical protein ABI59_22660 [Acidobacteria bacterium Mor1]|nr:hypothetical protein ABI59_22660 [Acidobacteria bacterium Mor1]